MSDDNEREQQRAFYRGWTQAMELIEGSGDTAQEIAREALQPCRHDASTGGICDWCGENDGRGTRGAQLCGRPSNVVTFCSLPLGHEGMHRDTGRDRDSYASRNPNSPGAPDA